MRCAQNGRVRLSTLEAAIWLSLVALSGCAGVPSVDQEYEPDRLENMNRGIYQFNDAMDRALIKPPAKAYRRIVPAPVARRVRNFFTNLAAPVDIINNMLQGKFKPGFSDLGRFLFNSTVGLAGLFDPAGKIGMERHPEDFGQTLAVWGVGQGPYIVLPFFGANTLRDIVGWIVDLPLDPLIRLDDNSSRLGLFALKAITIRVSLLPAERALEESLDPYVFLREAYLQRRRYEIYDGDPPQESFLEEEYIDELDRKSESIVAPR